MSTKKAVRPAKNMMYTQFLQKLPTGTLKQLVECIEQELMPKEYAVIMHDKDVNKEGNPIDKHIHAMLCFENARSLQNVAKILGDEPQYLERWKGNRKNGYSYLVHASKGALDKYQYSPTDVIANFDFVVELERITQEVKQDKQKRESKIPFLLDALYDGIITKEEIEQRLTGSQYGRYRRQIEDIWNKHLSNLADDWRQEMIERGIPVKIIWIYGAAGTGKSSIAIMYAENAGLSYYRTGSSRDLFQRYAGERVLIIEELRPHAIPYEDLLRILDPYSYDSMAPSRYSDKRICCETIIVCSPYSPRRLYDETIGVGHAAVHYTKTRMEVDSFEQLNRRIALTLEVDNYHYRAVEYDKKHGIYNPIPGTERTNPYSSVNRPKSSSTAVDLFSAMFDTVPTKCTETATTDCSDNTNETATNDDIIEERSNENECSGIDQGTVR